MLRIFLLGPFEVDVNDQRLPATVWKRRKAKTLLKLLALRPLHQLHIEAAMDLLWPELSSADSRNNLDRTLYYLRRSLASGGAAPALTLSDGMLTLGGPVWTDVAAFEQALAGADERATLEAAVALYRGPLLEEDRNEEWVIEPRQRLAAQHRELLRRLAALHQAARSYPAMIGALQRILDSDATDEQAHRDLMRAFVLAGRRSDALSQYQRCRAVLDNELGLEPEAETETLYAQIVRGEISPDQRAAAPAAPIASPAARLPAPSNALIGRAAEVAAVAALLRQPGVRLVTLIGPPGVGKTRLGLAVAAAMEAEFSDGAVLVPLALISDPAQLAATIAHRLGLQIGADGASGGLIEQVYNRQLLLCLDNFEHLLAASDLLAELLAGCPQLKLLVTSRSVLQLSAEQVYIVPALALPDPQTGGALDGALRSAAVQLFVARASAAVPGFALSAESSRAVSEICQRVDGLPLLIELAAARIRSFPPSVLLQRLSHRLQVLTVGARDLPKRQQTLRAALDWSYELLEPGQQRLLAQLGVFSASWGAAAISAVCGADGASDDLDGDLAALVDHSLLQRAPGDDDAQYVMLATVHEYARALLQARPDAAATVAAHAGYFLGVAEAAAHGWYSGEQLRWLAVLDRERANLHSAMAWAVAGDPALALRLGSALTAFWRLRGDWRLGYDWLVAALTAAHDTGAVDDATVARALLAAGQLGVLLQDYDRARALLEESQARYAVLGDRQGSAHATFGIATILLYQHADEPQALALLEESLTATARLATSRA